MWRAVCLSGCLMLTGSASAATPDEPPLMLLEQARLAAQRLDYSGVFFHQFFQCLHNILVA
jgi:hypothetical protein